MDEDEGLIDLVRIHTSGAPNGTWAKDPRLAATLPGGRRRVARGRVDAGVSYHIVAEDRDEEQDEKADEYQKEQDLEQDQGEEQFDSPQPEVAPMTKNCMPEVIHASSGTSTREGGDILLTPVPAARPITSTPSSIPSSLPSFWPSSPASTSMPASTPEGNSMEHPRKKVRVASPSPLHDSEVFGDMAEEDEENGDSQQEEGEDKEDENDSITDFVRVPTSGAVDGAWAIDQGLAATLPGGRRRVAHDWVDAGVPHRTGAEDLDMEQGEKADEDQEEQDLDEEQFDSPHRRPSVDLHPPLAQHSDLQTPTPSASKRSKTTFRPQPPPIVSQPVTALSSDPQPLASDHSPPPQPIAPLPAHLAASTHARPYTGNYRGCSWNCEALMAVKAARQAAKCSQMSKLMASHDFGVFVEAHCTAGKERAFALPQDCVGHWSHFSARRAGVGIVLRRSFLEKFATFQDGDFQELEPGRIARLRLRGPAGNLDIWAVYLTTGEGPTNDRQARDRSHQTIQEHLATPRTTLSILAGDWNYVPYAHDRWCCSAQNWSGHRDETEAAKAMEDVFHPKGLHELYQEAHTYFSSTATSRIDRVYTNHHPSEQLDHKFGCNPLPRVPGLSSHAPLSFFRIRPACDSTPISIGSARQAHDERSSDAQDGCGDTRTTTNIPVGTINHPDWARRVAAELACISDEPRDYDNPVRKLVLVKRAMHTVSGNMAKEGLYATASSNDDKLSCTLSFVRAAQAVNLDKMYRKYLEYPHIATFVNPKNPNACFTDGFRALLDHAVSLARQSITEELGDMRKQRDEGNHDYKTTIRKTNVLSRLKRIMPGSCTTVGALETATGEYATDPTAIGKELSSHWAKTFQKQPINQHLLQEWLRSLPAFSQTPHQPATAAGRETRRGDAHQGTGGPHRRARPHRTPLPSHERHWCIRKTDIERAIRHSGNSAPGPDGVPFQAWRALGPLGASILFDVAQCFGHSQGNDELPGAFFDEALDHPHNYNESILVCLPKKSSSTTPDGVNAYVPANTRPLNIVNADNRIVASAARNRWEEHLAKWILPRQQGFLPGRSILANLLDVDTSSIITSLQEEHGACLLMDFASAFPSISQEFMFTVLSSIGIPDRAMNTIRALYSESYCVVRHGKSVASGFRLEAGVRQGCPLSPLLYATVAEVLMDRIEQDCPDVLVRAYADDTALVLTDFWKDAPKLQRIFDEFGNISGLRLNLQKCVTIPLGQGTLEQFQQRRDRCLPEWASMPVTDCGKYLGFMVGPGKGEQSWGAPNAKFIQRCRDWSEHGVGMHFHTVAYNTFAISTLGYIGQLESAPQETLELEEVALRKTHKGPGEWASPDDLWRLKEHFGQSASCQSVYLTAKASQLRVRVWDPACTADHYQRDVRELRQSLQHPRHLHNRIRWDDWYSRAFAITLEDNLQWFTHHICPIGDICNSLDDPHDDHVHNGEGNDDEALVDGGGTATQTTNRSNTRAPPQRPQDSFQRRAYQKLLTHYAPHPSYRIRHKFLRWDLQNAATHPPPPGTSCRCNTPAWQARRALAHLQLLPKLVPPRVCAAVFSTLWNRWCTCRRYQQRHSPHNRCVLGCGGDAQDSIEHYCRCPVTKHAMERKLNMSPSTFAHLHTFLLCNANIRTYGDLTSVALLIYAIYNATNHYRHKPPTQDTDIHDAVAQWLREGAKRHANATKVFDNRWHPARRDKALPPIPGHL